MEADPDAELMLRLKNGDDSVLNELMTRWQEPLVGFIYRYIGDETDALDLAQETFVRIYETRHRYTVRGKFSTWLFVIAGNLCRNYLRWRQRRGETAVGALDAEETGATESPQSPGDSPDQAAMRSETISLVQAALDKLPPDLATVVLLYEYHSLTYTEIASVFGCSVKAVEMRLYRARRFLRDTLARHELS